MRIYVCVFRFIYLKFHVSNYRRSGLYRGWQLTWLPSFNTVLRLDGVSVGACWILPSCRSAAGKALHYRVCDTADKPKEILQVQLMLNVWRVKRVGMLQKIHVIVQNSKLAILWSLLTPQRTRNRFCGTIRAGGIIRASYTRWKLNRGLNVWPPDIRILLFSYLSSYSIVWISE